MNAVTKIERQEVAIAESTSLMAVIERAATNPDVDIDKMERLMAMHERMCAKQAETAFGAAMVEAQSEMRRISADANNKQTSSKYATYAALDRELRPIYTRHGFAVSFDTGEPEPEAVNVVAYVSHNYGHTRTYHVRMPADGKGAKGGDVMTKTHAAGAAMSYGMRYLLKMIFNVAIGEDDDDGNLGPRERVTPGQAADLRALAEEVGADIPKFLDYMKAESFEDILASQHKVAIAALNAKRNAKEAK